MGWRLQRCSPLRALIASGVQTALPLFLIRIVFHPRRRRAIMVEIRSSDVAAARLVAPLDHRPTAIAVAAERAMLATVEGSCRTPIGVLTEGAGEYLRMTGQLLSPDGQTSFEATKEGPADHPAELGDRLGRELLWQAGPGFLAKWGM